MIKRTVCFILQLFFACLDSDALSYINVLLNLSENQDVMFCQIDTAKSVRLICALPISPKGETFHF